MFFLQGHTDCSSVTPELTALLASGLGFDKPFLRISTISGEEPWLHWASVLTVSHQSRAACCMMVSIILPDQFTAALPKIWLHSVLWTEMEIPTSEFISFLFLSSCPKLQMALSAQFSFP